MNSIDYLTQIQVFQHSFNRVACHKNKKMPNLLRPDMFFQAENAPKLFSAGVPPQTSLGESLMLPSPLVG